MDNLASIIELAWKTSPTDTEYYVRKHVQELKSIIGSLHDCIEELEYHYSACKDELNYHGLDDLCSDWNEVPKLVSSVLDEKEELIKQLDKLNLHLSALPFSP